MQPRRRLATMTPLERCCAGVIAEYWVDLGRSPSFREIQHELSMASKAGVARLITGLERKGWLEPRRKQQRFALGLAVSEIYLPVEHAYEPTPAGAAFLAKPPPIGVAARP